MVIMTDRWFSLTVWAQNILIMTANFAPHPLRRSTRAPATTMHVSATTTLRARPTEKASHWMRGCA
jgi:hypothetical protein